MIISDYGHCYVHYLTVNYKLNYFELKSIKHTPFTHTIMHNDMHMCAQRPREGVRWCSPVFDPHVGRIAKQTDTPAIQFTGPMGSPNTR